MRTYTGRVVEIQMDRDGRPAARIACPPEAMPLSGQYLSAITQDETAPVLGMPLFPADIRQMEMPEAGFLAAPPIPVSWQPGTSLSLRGPIGRGFSLSTGVNRLALVALVETARRLMPLALSGLAQEAAVALFTDCPLPSLPSSLEVHRLESLPESISWADLIAIDLPMEILPELRSRFGLGSQASIPCPTQVLVMAAMPCSGLADCGACWVPARRGWKLACKDGPVFDLEELDW